MNSIPGDFADQLKKAREHSARVHEILAARLAKASGTPADAVRQAAINPTEADGSSQIDGHGYGDTQDSRIIPGTRTIQSPAMAKDDDLVEDADADGDADGDVAAMIEAARAQAAAVTKAIAARVSTHYARRRPVVREAAVVKKGEIVPDPIELVRAVTAQQAQARTPRRPR